MEITITAGAKEGAYISDDPGSHAATLVTFEKRGPFTSLKDGKDFMMLEWGFALEGMPDDACMVWASSGESTGPKSKTFGIVSALCGGKQPPIGTKLDIERDLVGRMALVDVGRKPDGYMEVRSVTPLPKAMQPKAPAAPADDTDDKLPF